METFKVLKDYRKLDHIKEIMRVNIIFFLFFMLSDSMDVFMPLFFKSHNQSATLYGGLQTVATVCSMGIVDINKQEKESKDNA